MMAGERVPLKDPDLESGKKNPEDDPMEAHGVVFEDKFAFWQVTIRTPLDMNPLNLIALAYGFLPFLVPAMFIVEVIATAVAYHRVHLFSTWGLLIVIFCFILNEFILKPILKQPRPIKTANKHADGSIKPGMPSGHVYNASALMVWLLCEVVHSGPGFDDADHMRTTIRFMLYIFLLMGPVPWARVYNYDHTVNQCLVSSVLGLITGVTAHLIRAAFVHEWCEPWNEEPFTTCFNEIKLGSLINATSIAANITNSTLLGSGLAGDDDSTFLALFG